MRAKEPAAPLDNAVSIAEALAGTRPAYWTLWRTMEAALLADHAFEPPLLDLGCGDGVFARMLFPQGAGCGVELMPDVARAGVASGHFRAVIQADGHRLPFAPASFQTVFSNCVLEHVADLPAVLGEVHRVLRPGGHLLCTVPSERFSEWLLGARVCAAVGWRRGAAAYAGLVNRVLVHRNLLTVDAWHTACAAAGLRLTAVHPFASARTLAAFDALLWLAVPGHVVHRLTGLRPFLRGRAWARALARAAGPREEGGGLVLVAERPGDGEPLATGGRRVSH